jgi:glycosyltransferase involved in cell wall biosynthesis
MGKQQRIIISVTNDLVTDNRVNKVCLFLIEEGYQVTLVGRKLKNSLEIQRRNYSTKRFILLFTKGPLFYLEFNFRLFFYLLMHRSSIIISNDLDTLLANYLVSKVKKVKLVYDTHEYFTEVPELVENPTKQKIWETLEGWIFPKLKNVYTVNESIAQIYRAKYHVAVNVVRNVAPTFSPLEIKNRPQLDLPTDKFIIILQGSGINKKRGAEEAVESMKWIEGALLVIIGGGDVLESLKQQVELNSIGHKVRFLPKMPYAEMMQYTCNADLGLAIDHTDVLNHKLALPNKFFDYIQAQIPILATDLTEVKSLIQQYEIGFILDTTLNAENLSQKIKEIMHLDSVHVKQLKENLKRAKQQENWTVEVEKLKGIYSNLN